MDNSEDLKNLNPGFLDSVKRFAMLIEFIHHVALMRYYQKSFFREKESERLKREYLEKARKYEKLVDTLLEKLWPGGQEGKQQNMF
jgi:hypothetical protein